jgi:hypothetical protein
MAGENPLLNSNFFKEAMRLKEEGKNPLMDMGGEKTSRPIEEAAPAAAPGSAAPASAAPDAGRPDFKNMSIGERANMSIGEKAMLTMQNVPESFSKNTGDIAYAVTNPVETAGALWNVGEGAVSKAAGALGFEQDKAQKAKTEGALDASISGLAERFGSWEGFEEALITDPIGVLMDLGTFIPLAGAGAKAAGLAKAAKVLDTAKYLDPLTAAGAATNAVMTPVLGTAKHALGVSTGTGKSVLDQVQEAGRSADPNRRAAVSDFARGSGDPKEIINDALRAANEGDLAAKAEFRQRLGQLAQDPLPTTAVTDALQKARDGISISTDPRTGLPIVPAAYKLELDAIEGAEGMLRNHGNFTPEGMHELKVAINQYFNDMGVAQGRSKSGLMGGIPDAIKKTINRVDPKYQEAMDFWVDYKDRIRNLSAGLGQNSRAGSATQLAKMMKEMKKGKTPLLDILSKYPSGKYLKDKLAGASIHELFPNWFQQANPLLQTLGGVGVGTGAVLGMVPHVAGTMAASSPRLVGSAMYGAGAAQRAGKVAADVLRTPTWAASTLGELAQEQSEENPIIKTEATPVQSVQGSMFAGGRIGRRSGGRVGNPGSVAEKLIRAAEQAKNRHSDGTSPLLNVPDEAITKALAIANEKI